MLGLDEGWLLAGATSYGNTIPKKIINFIIRGGQSPDLPQEGGRFYQSFSTNCCRST